MDFGIIFGNLSSVVAMGFDSFSSTRKTPKGVLTVQCISQAIYGVSAIALGGYSATVQNAVSILRNCAAMGNVKSKWLEWLLAALGVALGIAFNNRGWIGLLPVIGNLQYTLGMFRFKDDERKIKLFFLISVAAYAIFNVFLYNYLGALGDLVVIVTTVIALLKDTKKKA